jgi:c(7)-type cytochrome triheme protein
MMNNVKTPRNGKRGSIPTLRRFEVFTAVCGLFLFGYAIVVGFTGRDAASLKVETAPETEAVVLIENQTKDYSRFTHSNQFHSRLPCLLCHTRSTNSASIGFPGKSGHLPCAGCHALQFSDNTSPICTICHTSTGMKRFPSLRSFGFRFDHAKHTRANCATCHRAEGRGIAKSIPAGRSAHTVCFQCHTASSSNSMASCGTCHVPGRLVRTPEWTSAFRKNFSHAKHTVGKSLNCATCHTVRAGFGRGKQVSAPLASMHFASAGRQSCASCHNGKRAFGPDDFSNCKRCHNPKTFRF